MGSQRRNEAFTDFWSEIAASKEHEQQQQQQQHQPQPEIAVIYRRRRATNTDSDNDTQISLPSKENRLSLAPTKRISWNRSLSTRGRTSILISAGVDYQPQQRQRETKKKPKQAAPRPPIRKNAKPPSYEKERAYFEEVDSFELVEESPSPKNFGTWATDVQPDHFVVPHFSSRLGKWLVSKKLEYSCGPSGSLCGISESPLIPMEVIYDTSVTSNETTPERAPRQCCVDLPPVQNNPIPMDELSGKKTCLGNSNIEDFTTADEGCEDIGEDLRRLSLTPRPASLNGDQHDPFETLLRVCNQLAPSTLLDLFTQYCDPGSIVKLGEGTYGEVFKAGATVCKIVPIDGDIKVTGEVQKRSEELFEEVMLSWTLNCLRGREGVVDNACTTFIETLDIRICQGSYDAALIKAWEEYDLERGSENAHPKEYPDKQCYVVFVLAHGGMDLESFVLSNFQEAQSLLVQVTAALAVAEAAYEFEHRDLHWGNILLTGTEDSTVQFILEGKQIWARAFGLSISIIDFTLSRINTGTAICFLDLSADPELFEGDKKDKQSQTYCKMKEVTNECWQGSFPKTNVLWLQYLIDILLLKKTFKRTTKNERELRSLKKSLNAYSSSREAIGDPFFSELLVEHAM